MVTADGVAGDCQADHRVHGAPDKAVYAYPIAAYPLWRAATPLHAERLIPGAMGENLTVAGWTDSDVCIGDRVRIGTALLQVTEPRTPCYKLGLAFADPAMVRIFARVAVSGWYYRVLEAGDIGDGDDLTRVDRFNPEWTVARFFATITGGAVDSPILADIVRLDGVSDGWRRKAERLLKQRGS